MTKNTNFPRTVSVELPKDKLTSPFAANIPVQILNSVLNMALKGAVNKDGVWTIKPAPGWLVEKLSLGVYKVHHNIGHASTTLSITLDTSPGSFEVLEHHKDYFIIAVKVDREPTDVGFIFSLSPVIVRPT